MELSDKEINLLRKICESFHEGIDLSNSDVKLLVKAFESSEEFNDSIKTKDFYAETMESLDKAEDEVRNYLVLNKGKLSGPSKITLSKFISSMPPKILSAQFEIGKSRMKQLIDEVMSPSTQ